MKKRITGIDLSDFLSRIYAEKLKRNSRLSIRAFARQLDMSDSSLAQMMKGHRKIGKNTLRRISERLDIPIRDIVGKEHSGFLKNTPKLVDDRDIFENPFAFIILEMTNISGFRPSADWISRKLGVPETDITSILETLINKGCLKKVNGTYIDNTGSLTELETPVTTNESLRNKQKRLLDISRETVDQVPRELRDHSAIMVACNRKNLMKIRKRITEFRRELGEYMDKNKANSTDVYALQISLFPLTKDLT